VSKGYRYVQVRATTVQASWWLSGGISAANCIAAYQAKGAASYAASLVNLANPSTYDLTTAAAPTWNTATGWTDDDASKYLLSGLTWHTVNTVIIKFANGVASYPVDRTLIGAADGFNVIRGSSTDRYYQNGNNWLTVSGCLTDGVMAIANDEAYVNGVTDGAISTGVISPSPVYILNNPNVNRGGLCDVIAVAFYNIELTTEQVAAVGTAMGLL
jgi:hypothetical protein